MWRSSVVGGVGRKRLLESGWGFWELLRLGRWFEVELLAFFADAPIDCCQLTRGDESAAMHVTLPSPVPGYSGTPGCRALNRGARGRQTPTCQKLRAPEVLRSFPEVPSSLCRRLLVDVHFTDTNQADATLSPCVSWEQAPPVRPPSSTSHTHYLPTQSLPCLAAHILRHIRLTGLRHIPYRTCTPPALALACHPSQTRNPPDSLSVFIHHQLHAQGKLV